MALTCLGFRFAGVHAGIKDESTLDLALLTTEQPAACAAVFTRNRVRAAPVLVSQAALRASDYMNALVVNSGNANACTGHVGKRHAKHMVNVTADALGIDRTRVLVASTGVIGVPLPIDAVERGIVNATSKLSTNGFGRFSRAILTTDRGPKTAVRKFNLAGAPVTLLGCTKGAGMIAPNMATTLSFVVTDARIAPRALQTALHSAVTDTYNAITVDGDTSTNDMISVMANGMARNRALRRRDQDAFCNELRELLNELAHKLMRTGEGVHHVVDVVVENARTTTQARAVARTIANSPLVKTAIAGQDPNWGRILCAAGNANVPISPSKLALWIGRQQVVAAGIAVGGTKAEARAQREMAARSYSIRLALHQGTASAHCLCCDLSHDYVSINADYRS